MSTAQNRRKSSNSSHRQAHPVNHRKSSVQDDTELAHLGHEAELSRNFSFLAMLGLAFAILNSWTALAASMSLSLDSGGPTAVLWGLLTAGFCNMCLALSMAEFLSAYPTAGGQYHWVAMIAWDGWGPILSWAVGWINVFGWIALTATGSFLGSQLVINIIFLEHPDYSFHRWHQFFVYLGYTIFAFLMNAFANNTLPYFNKAAFIWSLTGFGVICIVVLACSSPNYAGGDFVFQYFLNGTGWPDGLAWLLGLLQGGLGVTGYDAVAHMIEEIPNARVEGPKIMVYAVAIGTCTGWIFLLVMLFVSGGFDQIENIITSTAGPLLQIFYNATSSKAGSIVLLMFPCGCLLFATTSIMTTSSRMTYAFARDGGLPASGLFATVHSRLGQPLYSMFFTTVFVVIFGCFYLGANAAFQAIASSSVVALSITYAFPVAVNCLRGRKMLPEDRWFKMPGWIAWTVNIIGVLYVILTSVLFMFPAALPVTGSNMNYCVAAFAIVLIISTVQWWIDGRKNFTGPRIEIVDEAGEFVPGVPTTSNEGTGHEGRGKPSISFANPGGANPEKNEGDGLSDNSGASPATEKEKESLSV